AVLIHLMGGRIEAHFHVFGSLAFLSFYRDNRILLFATVITAADHIIRGMYWPQTIYGVNDVERWRWLEHSAWVIFEDVFLMISCRYALKERWSYARQQARLELLNQDVSREVARRTQELAESAAQIHSILDATADPILSVNKNGRLLSSNRAGIALLGFNPEHAGGSNLTSLIENLDWRRITHQAQFPARGVSHFVNPAGFRIPIEYCATDVEGVSTDKRYIIGIRDISEHVQAEADKSDLQQQLVSAARQAGKAEIANGVLHNVGNVLNTIATSQSIIAEILGHSRAGRLRDLSKMLASEQHHLTDFLLQDPRGKQVPAFIEGLAGNLEHDLLNLKSEVDTIGKSVGHIKVVIGTQQNMAKAGGLKELNAPASIVEEAVAFKSDRLQRHAVRIQREFQDVPDILVDRNQLLQVLINFVKNAIDALVEAQTANKVLCFMITRTEDYVRISVRDNGPGISRENRTRIFTQGFTTKPNGHGFGLHFSACVVKELGGRIGVESDGPGCGACFFVELPLQLTGASL
ncbi:MAG: ATP-binding protein, partial [Planctomycetales bacterium]